MSTHTGVVLAGGFATRFGERDKTLATLDGRPLLAHAADGLAPAVEHVVVSCREAQIADFERVLDDVIFCPDPTPDEGPLAGLDAALDSVDSGTLALVTADMPCVPTALYDSLFDALDGVDCVAIQSDGFLQPAPAVFETAALRASVATRRDSGDARLRSVFEDLDTEHWPAERVTERWGERALADVNTREDLAALR